MLGGVTVPLYDHSEKTIYFCEEAKLKSPPFLLCTKSKQNYLIANLQPICIIIILSEYLN